MRNRLGEATSPYLLQHRDNPVHWQTWGPEALNQARTENRPILLSVGYAACHWCHVMAHESFEDQATADIMNKLFVCIKVDREERPDIDAIYQQALSLMGEQGGWPLTMFLTPETEPYWGGTYFPPRPAYGRQGFPELLHQIYEVWTDRPETISKNTTALKSGLDRLSTPAAGPAPDALSHGGLTPGLMDTAARQLLGAVDDQYGGLSGAPKFPQPHIFSFLWRAARRTDAQDLADAVTLTLDQICQGGIYDHLIGGFARYSTDAYWLAPHFEKMLYDNALLIDLMTLVWRQTKSPLYAVRIRETIDWLGREMMSDGKDRSEAQSDDFTGAFTAALDADSEGEEGRFYVWQESEIDEILGTDSDVFKEHYDVQPGGNWEGKTILNRSDNLPLADGATEAALGISRNLLLAARAKRIRPGRDDKVLADWNGLMITALSRAAMVFDTPAWLQMAETAFATIIRTMTDGDRLHHTACAGVSSGPGFLDDYANMSEAAMALYEATGEASYLKHAIAWIDVLEEQFLDTEFGGYFFTAADGEALITRTRNATDNAVPAGNGTIVGVLARVWLATGEDRFRERALSIIDCFAGEVARNFIAITGLMNNTEFLHDALQVVIIGHRDDIETQALARTAWGSPDPNRILQIVAPGKDLPSGHPAHGKERIDGKPTAYVCRGQVCSLPVTDQNQLAHIMAGGVT
jgi:uncharacterized protein